MITPEYLARSGTEDGEQTALFCWAAQNMQRFPCLKWMYAIANGGARSPATAARLRATGVKKGVSDVCLPFPRSVWGLDKAGKPFVYHGLYIEMKRKDGVPSDIKTDQLDFLAFVKSQGYRAEVAFGWEQAVKIIEDYLS